MSANEPSLGLRNIGPQTEKWLRRVGITSKRQFETLGAQKTYRLLLEAGYEPNRDLLYALIGAEEDMDWRIVAKREKNRSRSRFADIDEP
jgi:DNA transformation protein and related proteins